MLFYLLPVFGLNRVAQERGITVKFDSDIFENNNTNAIWRNNTDGTREVILNPNADTKRTLQSVITHELTHDFEGTVEYNELKELVLNYDKENVDFENARKSLEDIYSRVYDRNSNEFKTLVEYDIVMDKSKILNILNKHNEMNDNLIKQIPDILENPTLILKSQTIKGRITVFSEINATDGKPILVAMELNPAENRNNVEKIYKVASAYGRQNIIKMQDWLNNQDNILYVDKQKNRTMNWLSGLGLQLPVPNNLSSSINSIASKNEDVNTTKHSMQKSENNTWQEYLDQNYKNTGMGQTIQDVKVAPTANNETSKVANNPETLYNNAEGESGTNGEQGRNTNGIQTSNLGSQEENAFSVDRYKQEEKRIRNQGEVKYTDNDKKFVIKMQI